jgi:hypothetical protein
MTMWNQRSAIRVLFAVVAWHWVSDIDGDLGRHPRLDTPNLSVGEHQITVSVRHNLGLSRGQVVVFVDSITATSSTR